MRCDRAPMGVASLAALVVAVPVQGQCTNDCGPGTIAEGEVCPTDGYEDISNGGCNSDVFNPAGQLVQPPAFFDVPVAVGSPQTICGTSSTRRFPRDCGGVALPLVTCDVDADCPAGLCIADPDSGDGNAEGTCANCDLDADCPDGNCLFDPSPGDGSNAGWCDVKLHRDCIFGCRYDCSTGPSANDGWVSMPDLFELFGHWGQLGPCTGLDPAGIIELFSMFSQWGQCTDICVKAPYNTQSRQCTETFANIRDTDWYRISAADLTAADGNGNGVVQVVATIESEFPGIVFVVGLGAGATPCNPGSGILGDYGYSAGALCNVDADCVGPCFGDPNPWDGNPQGVCSGDCTANQVGEAVVQVGDHEHGIVVFASIAYPWGQVIPFGVECAVGFSDYLLTIELNDT